MKGEFAMVAIKRKWVPEWLYSIYALSMPPWFQPFRWIFNKHIEPN